MVKDSAASTAGHDSRDAYRRCLRGFGLFVLFFLIAALVLPFVPFLIPGFFHYKVENFLFFWPQAALLPFGFHQSFGSLMHVTIPIWVIGATVFGFATRKLPTIYVALLAYPTLVVAVIAEEWILHLFGWTVYHDGP